MGAVGVARAVHDLWVGGLEEWFGGSEVCVLPFLWGRGVGVSERSGGDRGWWW